MLSGFLLFALFPDAEHAKCSRNQEYAYGDHTGNGCCVAALGRKAFHIALNGVVHGVVNTGTGNQRENRDNQIGDGGIFADSGHQLCIDRSGKSTPEITNPSEMSRIAEAL